jgi:hypothetical protein
MIKIFPSKYEDYILKGIIMIHSDKKGSDHPDSDLDVELI